LTLAAPLASPRKDRLAARPRRATCGWLNDIEVLEEGADRCEEPKLGVKVSDVEFL